MNEAHLREELTYWGKSLFDRGLTAGSSGNISVRLDDGMLITPTNSCLGRLDPVRISRLDGSGRHVDGDAPSKELPLHRAFLETRPGAGAVVHLHSSYATALSCLDGLDEDDCVDPVTPYVVMRNGNVKLLPYVRPGDPGAGEMIRKLDGRYGAVLLANHGPVVSGRDLVSAIFAAEELEEAAKLMFILRNTDARILSQVQVVELKQRFPSM
ncbi:MAG: 3-oxo-tetronate 4-phosphate decarboxylase [Pseudaminobacter sp.]